MLVFSSADKCMYMVCDGRKFLIRIVEVGNSYDIIFNRHTSNFVQDRIVLPMFILGESRVAAAYTTYTYEYSFKIVT